MADSVDWYEAKSHLPALLERVAKGESITITRHGKPVAQLVPVQVESKPDVRNAVREMLEFRDKSGPVLADDVTIRDLIHEGRRS